MIIAPDQPAVQSGSSVAVNMKELERRAAGAKAVGDRNLKTTSNDVAPDDVAKKQERNTKADCDREKKVNKEAVVDDVKKKQKNAKDDCDAETENHQDVANEKKSCGGQGNKNEKDNEVCKNNYDKANLNTDVEKRLSEDKNNLNKMQDVTVIQESKVKDIKLNIDTH